MTWWTNYLATPEQKALVRALNDGEAYWEDVEAERGHQGEEER